MKSDINDHAVTLLLPELLPGGAQPQELGQYKFLQRILAETQPAQVVSASLESAVMKWFHGDNAPQQNCAACLGYRLDHSGAIASQTCLRADPVYQQMDINHAVLADRSLIDVSDTESSAIITDLNSHFSSDGVRFENGGNGRWYCLFESGLTVQTTSPGAATGRNVSLVMPKGPGAGRWRGWLAEIEMLLYTHPVNVNRAQQGKTLINSLWLWGEGNIAELRGVDALNRQVCTDDFYTRSLADNSEVPCNSLEHFRNLSPGESVLVVEARMAAARATGNQQQHESLLQSLERHVFPKLYQGVHRHGWTQANLWLGDDRWLTLAPGTLWTHAKSFFSRSGLHRG